MPGRMGRCVSAMAAVSVRRGSTTTRRPPRARSARSRRSMPGAVMRLPLETSGLAPSIEEERRAIDVGHGQEELVPEHQQRGQHVRELVHRRRGVAAARPQRAQQQLADRSARRSCGRSGCPGRRRRRARPCAPLDVDAGARRPGRAPRPSRSPPSRAPRRRSGRRRRSGSSCRSFKAHGLRADVAAAEDVGLVTADGEDPVPVDLDGEAAHRLAQGAGPEMGWVTGASAACVSRAGTPLAISTGIPIGRSPAPWGPASDRRFHDGSGGRRTHTPPNGPTRVLGAMPSSISAVVSAAAFVSGRRAARRSARRRTVPRP